ncbi:hypothetical protein [Neorhizobium sp. T6_25]|uniref:hypothetical protein n=1 Tax=Neorhizobium sp. T6_25 TaxID=2093833 RepID=UPI000CF9BAC6|nr:hypothetical protein [Neorhizobium sp. T6_25]
MNTTIRTLLASAFLFTAGSALAADGEYYQGVSARQSVMTDNLHTGSVEGEVSAQRLLVDQASAPVNSGDYWDSANRQN